jgi:hypothetical protein
LPARSCTATACPPRRSLASGSTGRAASLSATPTAGVSTATVPTTMRSGRCSSSHRRGRPTAPTATATADTTRSTSMTRPPPPRATSARPAEICVRLPVSSGRCGPTTRQRVMCPRCSLSRPHTPRVPASWFRYRQP